MSKHIYRAKKRIPKWMPKRGQFFWIFDCFGKVQSIKVAQPNEFVKFGNCFKTEWEAQRAAADVALYLKTFNGGRRYG